jgi:predicted porin
MSRKYVLLLVAAVFALPALAETCKLPVEIYGVVHVSTDLQNNGDQSEVYVSSNTTRLGIKGSLPTNNELFTVIWQWESQVDFNNNVVDLGGGNEYESREDATWAGRNSFAGVKGEWGKLIWGRYDTPFKTLGRQVEFFPERIGDARNATRLGSWDERPTNMLMYWTPLLSECVTVAAQYVPDQGLDGGQAFSASALYDKDGIKAGAAMEIHGSALEGGAESATGIRAMARYQGEGYAVGGMLQTISNFRGVDGVSAMTYGLGGSYLVKPEWEVKAQYYAVDPNTDVDDNGGTMLTAGVDYILGDNTRLYLNYATMMNQDATASFSPFAGGHGQFIPAADAEAPVGNDPGLTLYGISVGLVTSF